MLELEKLCAIAKAECCSGLLDFFLAGLNLKSVKVQRTKARERDAFSIDMQETRSKSVTVNE